MSTRRDFLRSSLVLAGGLIVGDAAIEAFERLSHRKVFALGAPNWEPAYHPMYFSDRDLQEALRQIYARVHAEVRLYTTPLVLGK